jgi:hypothetical protein
LQANPGGKKKQPGHRGNMYMIFTEFIWLNNLAKTVQTGKEYLDTHILLLYD